MERLTDIVWRYKVKKWRFIALLLVGISAAVSSKDYKGAELYSKEMIKYGRFEFRMKTVYGGGILSTFFLYYNESYKGLPEPWREIDLEVMGKIDNGFQSNIITGDAGDKETSEEMHTFDKVLSEGYHTYAIEWTPDYIAWYFDSVEVRRTTGSQVLECQDTTQSYRFNLWISSVPVWAGTFNESVLPVYQYINWIKYSTYTPGAGPDGSNFTPAWIDDFDRFDTKRWAKADWTFDENLVDFVPSNVVVKDGYMILCLTKSDALGHSGPVPLDDAVPVAKKKSVNLNKTGFEVAGKYPMLQFNLSERQPVNVQIYSLQGKRIGTVNLGYFDAGKHNVNIADHFKTLGKSALIYRIGNENSWTNRLMLH